ncbi:hypothetical protein ACLB2K_065091 [Fragaria x ananassa]
MSGNIEFRQDTLKAGSHFRLECRGDEVLNLNISAPRLKRLQIRFCAVPEDDPYATDGGYEYKIFVNANAPNLEEFNVKYLLASYTLNSVKSLSKVELKFKGLHAGENLYFAGRIHKLFAEIVNVKYLSVLASIVGDPDIAYQYPMPTFNNLNQLELRLQTCCSWQSLPTFLNASPNLEYLVLENNINCRAHGADIDDADDGDVDDSDDYDSHISDNYDEDDLVHEWSPPRVVPICLLSCLKTIYQRGFRGRSDEIEVAGYLLKNGKVLNKVTIHTSNFCEESVMELWQTFSRLPRGSKTCEIEWILPKL